MGAQLSTAKKRLSLKKRSAGLSQLETNGITVQPADVQDTDISKRDPRHEDETLMQGEPGEPPHPVGEQGVKIKVRRHAAKTWR